MPHNKETDEYYDGSCPSRKAENEKPEDYPTPDFFLVYNELLGRAANVWMVTICGFVYKGSNKVGGDSRKKTLDEIEEAALSQFTHQPGYETLESTFHKFFDMKEEPIHITGIFFYPLD